MSAAPLPPERYRALRARYNALLITLYERTSLTLREIAVAAGRTERGVQMLVRRLRCIPRNAKRGRPGFSRGERRAGPRPPPLNAPATRRVAAAFADVARELAASAEARIASDMERAVGYTVRRAARVQTRMIASAARELRHYTTAFEHLSAAQHMDAAGPKAKAGRSRSGKPGAAPKRRSRAKMRIAQKYIPPNQEGRMHERHEAARAIPAAPATPSRDAHDRRIDAIAERTCAERPGEPRIRGL